MGSFVVMEYSFSSSFSFLGPSLLIYFVVGSFGLDTNGDVTCKVGKGNFLRSSD